MHSIAALIVGLIQVLVILALAPLLTGIIRKTKARTQKRIGASILQPYYDLLKLVRKDEVVSDQTSWIFRACPWVNFAVMASAAFFIPVFLVYTPFGLVGDLLLVVGLFALGRFFTMLAGLDVASSFGGLGSSREMMISALLEPALFLSIFVVAITYGGTNLSTLIGASSNASFLPHPQIIFAAIGLFIIILGETGRLPFDNPATHLELTMVHETMILEYSGKSLALMEWSQSIKQIILFTLMINIFVPWGISSSILLSSLAVGFLTFIGKISLFGIFVAFLESSVAKWRLFRIPDLIAIAIATSMVGIVLCYL
jgi:formate hydrogenlyase subunit 4